MSIGIADLKRVAKALIDTHLAIDRSGVIGRDGFLHCEQCGAMRDESHSDPHAPNCVVLIAEAMLAAPAPTESQTGGSHE